MSPKLKWMIVGLIAVAGSLASSCRGELASSYDGKQIVVKVEDLKKATLEAHGERAIVEVGGKAYFFEKEKVMLDGKIIANVPEKTKEVLVTYTPERVEITVDKKSVYKSSP